MAAQPINRAFALALLMAARALASQDTPAGLKALELKGEAEFARKDCVSAEKTFGEAVVVAQAAGESGRILVYYLRLANCRLRVGDYPSALNLYQKGLPVAESIGDSATRANYLHGSALALVNLGRVEEAEPLAARELSIAEQAGSPGQTGRALWMMSAVSHGTGQTRLEISFLNRALAISRASNDTALTGVVLAGLAIAYGAIGDLETAAHMEYEILDMNASALSGMASTYSNAIVYNNLGDIQLKAGQKAEARRSFQRAVDGSAEPDRWKAHATALLNLSGRQNEDGEPAAADASFRTALRMVQDLKFPDLETCAWQMHSDDLLLRGDRDGARQAGEEALRIARSLANSSRIYRALVSLGSAETAGGAAAAARGHFDEAAGIADTIRAQSPGEASDLGRAYANLNPLYRASVRNLLDLKLPDEAFRRAEEAKARVLMNLLVRGGVDERASMTSAEVAEQTVLRKRLGTANALVEYRQFRRTLYENHPELALRSADFEAANLSELVALLPDSKTALLDYFFVSGGVALFVIRENSATDRTPRIATHLIPDPQHTLEAEARRYREMLASRDAGYKSVARRLYNRLIAPAAADLAGTTGWIVSPDGALWDVPFEALVDSEGRHVIETRTVTLAPSLTAALTIHQRSHPASADSVALLALGNPLPAAVPLPDAAREAAEIGAGFPRGSAVILTGRSATAKAFADRAGSAGIVHLAAHASLNDIDPLSSSVRLGTEEISALDLMSFHLRADLVVLSACETARGGTGGGEGAMGMGWALAAAGASSSVLSLWKIDSAASREFMTAFYRNLASKGKAGALRQAGLEMLRAPAYRHPFYWAAFTLQGDSGMAITPAAQ